MDAEMQVLQSDTTQQVRGPERPLPGSAGLSGIPSPGGGAIVQNKANLRRQAWMVTVAEKRTYERSGRVPSLRKQSQFGTLRLLRRCAPRNDMRTRGVDGWAFGRGAAEESVQNKANFPVPQETLTDVPERAYGRNRQEPAARKQSQFGEAAGWTAGTAHPCEYPGACRSIVPSFQYSIIPAFQGSILARRGDSGILGGRMVGKREFLGLEIERCYAE
jgi:hypothetical protein